IGLPPVNSGASMIGGSMVAGRSVLIWLTRASTSSFTFWASIPISNCTIVVETPSDTVDCIISMFGRPAIAFSTGRVTWFSSSVAAVPSWTMVTVTIGKAMFGNCLIGSCVYEYAPASSRRVKVTTTGIGLRIAQLEIGRFMSLASNYFAPGAVAVLAEIGRAHV